MFQWTPIDILGENGYIVGHMVHIDQAAIELARYALELRKTARALGMNPDEYMSAEKPNGGIADLEKAVKLKQAMEGESTWEAKMKAYSARRRRMAAARLAGASLGQIAGLLGISPQAVKAATSKELMPKLRDMLAQERTGRENRLTPTHVAAMLGSVSDEDALAIPVIVLAARMQTTIASKGDIELDEDDPYLRDETRTPSSRTGEG